MYKQSLNPATNQIVCVQRITDGAFVPFDPANTDYQQFKQDIAAGETLQDADGNDMTADAAKTFMETLP